MTLVPDALHVGFSKCASTFLQAFFESHPKIFLVNQSHFFAPFEYSRFPDGSNEYRRRFEGAAADQVKLESDEHILLPLFHPVLSAAATTLESVTEASARMKSIAREAKIIMVIRNQLDLITSRYSEYILGGGTGSFGFFVDEFLCCGTDGVNYYQNYYSRIIDILQADFGPGNVLVLLQEELSRDEPSFIAKLCGFLGVPVRQPERHTLAARRVGLSELGVRVVRNFNRVLVTRQEMSTRKAEVRIPYLAYKLMQRSLRIADYYLPKSIKGDRNSIVTGEVRDRIRSEFREDNARLAEKLRLDLSSLGYQ